MNKNINIYLLLGGSLILALVIRNMFSSKIVDYANDYLRTKEEKLPEAEIREKISQIKIGNQPTLLDGQIGTISRNLKIAMVGIGTNEDTVYRELSKLGNKSDFLLLEIKFGLVNGLDLISYIYDDFSGSELNKVKGILFNIGVSI